MLWVVAAKRTEEDDSFILTKNPGEPKPPKLLDEIKDETVSVRLCEIKMRAKVFKRTESWHARCPAFKLKVYTSKTIWTIQWTSALELQPEIYARITLHERAIFVLSCAQSAQSCRGDWYVSMIWGDCGQNCSSDDTRRATSVSSVHAKLLDGQQSVIFCLELRAICASYFCLELRAICAKLPWGLLRQRDLRWLRPKLIQRRHPEGNLREQRACKAFGRAAECSEEDGVRQTRPRATRSEYPI